MDSKEENRLIKKVQKHNDKNAANVLVSYYYREIYAFTYKQTVDIELSMDLTQDIFISALQSISGYDSKKSKFRTWLYRIASYKITDYYRSAVYGVYGLIAPNGAGKTTLLKLLTTLSFPDSGEILWNGTNIIKLGEQYREVIGFLPQKFGYYKDYSPYQYLKYLSALKGIKSELAEKRTLELLETVGLKDVINKKMKTFSGGMIQRVGIAQALLNNPQILMLDEPTAGLDPKERVRFRNIISGLSGERIVILSTHIVSDVETVANKIIMFDKSGIICNDYLCIGYIKRSVDV